MSPKNEALYWREAYETLVRQTGRDINDGFGIDSRRANPAPLARDALAAAREEGRAEGLATLHAIRDDYHARGCQGREYTCTCGYDERVEAAIGAPLDTKGGDNG